MSEAAATIRTVTSDDIEASGARTLDEALRARLARVTVTRTTS